ncbi:MAG TPA: LacI family DNA-binding transcriptional regulator [Natronosporangium sp.]|nr:LacI family DNA-binding transcriptional regulator [Natronosporangium sp.]
MSTAHRPARRGEPTPDHARRVAGTPPRGTLKDVAAAAGVHPSTASRSLDPTQAFRVRAETRERVLAAAARLGYQPHRLAGSLRRQRTSTVGVLVADYETPIYAALLRGISARLEREGCVPISLETQDRHDRLLDSIRILVEHRVDGVITAATRAQDLAALRDLVRSGTPVVMAVRYFRGAGIPIVANDDLRGGALAAEHLVRLGHRHLAQLHGPNDVEPFTERSLGYRSVLSRAGLLDPDPVDYADTPTVEEGRRLMHLVLQRSAQRPTAVFAHNDLIAIGAIEALHEAGLSCPEDVSVVGYNDMPLTEHLVPSLTTVRMPTVEVGRVAAETLLGLIRDRDQAPVSITLEPQLVARASTAPPRPRA